jgi:hypothetical protein
VLLDRIRFAGQQRLIDEEVARLEQPAVRGREAAGRAARCRPGRCARRDLDVAPTSPPSRAARPTAAGPARRVRRAAPERSRASRSARRRRR